MKKRRANIFFQGLFAGILEETAAGCRFAYDEDYLKNPLAFPISLSLPLSGKTFTSHELFPFFKNLVPEGWLFDLNSRTLKIAPNDHFGLLLATGADCIGAVSIKPIEE